MGVVAVAFRCDLCNALIDGATGLQELVNLIGHMMQKHGKPLGMNEALELRVVLEHRDDADPDSDSIFLS